MVVGEASLVEAVAAEYDRLIAESARAQEVGSLAADRAAVAIFLAADAAEHRGVHARAAHLIGDPRPLDAIGKASAAVDEGERLVRPRQLGEQVRGDDPAVVD